MTPELFRDVALRPALRLLPPSMSSPEAEAMVLAICLQESKIEHRRQIGGPARGFAQFEFAGVTGVLRHEATATHAAALCAALDVDASPGTVHAALEYQDLLAAGFARLLLWTLPASLPQAHEPHAGWGQYLAAWRPGKPHRSTFDDHFRHAWRVVALK